jgi:hypothetical protein
MTRRSLLVAALQEPAPDLSRLDEWCAADGSPFPESSWKFENGVFSAIGGLEVFQDIRTRRSFSDFEFRFTFTLARGGNSGVKYLIDKSDAFRGHIRARGKEFQLIDDENNPDADRPDHRCGALYNIAAPTVRAPFRAGEPAEARLVRRGSYIEHWINGTRVLAHDLPASDASRMTSISLQNHKSDCEFRQLRIRLGHAPD